MWRDNSRPIQGVLHHSNKDCSGNGGLCQYAWRGDSLWRTNDMEQIEQFRQDLYALNNIQKEDENVDDTIQKRNEYIQKTIQMDIDTIQKGIQKVLHERQQTITELQLSILLYFAKHPTASRKDYINDTEGATEGGTIAAIGRLQDLRLLSRRGGRRNGYWFVVYE